MRGFLFSCCLFFSFGVCSEAEIQSAQYDVSADELILQIRYPGGCKTHEFELHFNPWCLKSYPLQCSANLVETDGQDDPCKALVFKTLRFSMTGRAPRPAWVNMISGESMKRVFIPFVSAPPA